MRRPLSENFAALRRAPLLSLVVTILAAVTGSASAGPCFVNGLLIPGSTLDATRAPGAAAGRFGHFSDLYYDPIRAEWWALSDRGPGGGLLDYHVRLHRIDLRVHPATGRISAFRIKETVLLEDAGMRLDPTAPIDSTPAFNGLNPLLLNGNAAVLGRSLDPEGLVIDPRTGHFLVSDEYGPSVYEFNRRGVLVGVFETPAELMPRLAGAPNYVAGPDTAGSGLGRQDNRGFEGLAISPDGTRLFAALQDPLIEESALADLTAVTGDGGWDGRGVRIVVFDNDSSSARYRQSVAQYVYQLEPQLAIRTRILEAGGSADATNPRQGRDIGVSAMAAINAHEFLVVERDNRGIGVNNPAGRGMANQSLPPLAVVGSKRVFRIDIDGATDVSGMSLPHDANLAAVGVRPVVKDDAQPFIDLAADTVLPNGNQVEKWEALTIGPRLQGGGYVIVAGTDNDYSVAQSGQGEQFDIYVDLHGNFAACVLDSRSLCEVNPSAGLIAIDEAVPVPTGFTLLPGALNAYRASAHALAGYVPPRRWAGEMSRLPVGHRASSRLGQRHAADRPRK